MRLLDRSRARVGAAVFVLTVALAGELPRNLFTWWGWSVFAAAAVAVAVALLVHARDRFAIDTVPIPLGGFLILATLSVAWSHYPAASAAGVVLQVAASVCAVGVGLALDGEELLRALAATLRLVLGLSILFELVVSLIVRHPVYPVWVNPDDYVNPDAKLLLWSRDLLLEGGKIQGVVGNSSLLAMLALVGVIVFAIQLASRRVRPVAGTFWLLLALLLLALTRSATVLVGLAAVVVVTLAVIVVRRSRDMARGGGLVRGAVALLVVAVVAVAVAARGPLLALLGKSSDFTGRFDIWAAVTGLAEQRPAAGWGWIGYWAPWVDPFDHLVVKGGVQVMHAHNAWLDVWLQLGVIGLVVFGGFVLSALVRAWFRATDRSVVVAHEPARHDWLALLPLLVLVAQLVQSVAESRMLIEGGWVLFVLLAVVTKRNEPIPAPVPVSQAGAVGR